jgi:O-antigen/teichoic acid export membrane protein
MLVMLSLTIINTVTAPHVTRAFRDGNKVVLQKISKQSARAALAVSLPIALPLLFMAEPIIHLLFGEAYIESVRWPLFFLVLAQLINVAFGSVGLFLVMAGYERDALAVQVLALFIVIFSGLLLIPLDGVIGAALSVSIGLVMWNILLAIIFFKRLELRPSAF